MTNKTLEEYSEEEASRRLIPVIYLGILMIVGIIGNALVLISYPMKFSVRTHRTFITGLAIPDILVCLVIVPFEIVEMRYQYRFYNAIVCKLFRTCSHWFSMASIFVLTQLSYDTYQRICKPLKEQISIKKAKIYIGGGYIISLCLSSLSFFGSGIRIVSLDNFTVGHDCSLADEYVDTLLPVIGEGVITLMVFTCIFFLVLLYSLIGRKIFIQSKFRRQFHAKTSSESRGNKASNKIFTISKTRNTEETKRKSPESPLNRITKIAFMITVVFILSFIPHAIISLLTALKGSFLVEPGSVASLIMPILARSVMINNVVNPIIYGFMDKRFRQSCNMIWMNLVCCRSR
ncbi:unnamed protein product [Mytilus coruscus]|uniref:G-protein coupled receptors family 1 profile domain-containing protein n=1 Tax=Mytilus coruscus TaxID=42192 RepID=A0A6J8BWC4_MYTCO|nr:unnamed protein product [Mytilus coruscus]